MSISPRQYKQIMADRAAKDAKGAVDALPAKPKKLSTPKELNRWEKMFCARLQMLALAGDITWIGCHESVTLRLGPDCRYSPDFPVVEKGGRHVMYEVKGRRREDAMIKLRLAPVIYPIYAFYLCEFKGGVWDIQEVVGGALPVNRPLTESK